MLNSLILFVIGFYILVKGARTLVSGASSLARLFRVSDWVIGTVVVGVGTSIPELAINIASALNGGLIGISTIIGSNTFNILGILGLAALVYPITMSQNWVRIELLPSVLVIFAAAVIIVLPVVGAPGLLGISRPEGILLILGFGLWLWFLTRRRTKEVSEGADYKVFTFSTSLVFVVVGVIGVFFGGRWVVEGAKVIAGFFGLSPSVIGLTIVGIGTSLPELAVSLTAAYRRNPGIAVGNVIGSNVFDFLGILGLTALISPLDLPTSLFFDLTVTLIATGLLFACLFFGRSHTITRRFGLLFVILYILYLTLLFSRPLISPEIV